MPKPNALQNRMIQMMQKDMPKGMPPKGMPKKKMPMKKGK